MRHITRAQGRHQRRRCCRRDPARPAMGAGWAKSLRRPTSLTWRQAARALPARHPALQPSVVRLLRCHRMRQRPGSIVLTESLSSATTAAASGDDNRQRPATAGAIVSHPCLCRRSGLPGRICGRRDWFRRRLRQHCQVVVTADHRLYDRSARRSHLIRGRLTVGSGAAATFAERWRQASGSRTTSVRPGPRHHRTVPDCNVRVVGRSQCVSGTDRCERDAAWRCRRLQLHDDGADHGR